MRAWLKRLWMELKRDDLKEIAQARELYLRSVDAHRRGGAADSPENSPEAPEGETPKSL